MAKKITKSIDTLKDVIRLVDQMGDSVSSLENRVRNLNSEFKVSQQLTGHSGSSSAVPITTSTNTQAALVSGPNAASSPVPFNPPSAPLSSSNNMALSRPVIGSGSPNQAPSTPAVANVSAVPIYGPSGNIVAQVPLNPGVAAPNVNPPGQNAGSMGTLTQTLGQLTQTLQATNQVLSQASTAYSTGAGQQNAPGVGQQGGRTSQPSVLPRPKKSGMSGKGLAQALTQIGAIAGSLYKLYLDTDISLRQTNLGAVRRAESSEGQVAGELNRRKLEQTDLTNPENLIKYRSDVLYPGRYRYLGTSGWDRAMAEAGRETTEDFQLKKIQAHEQAFSGALTAGLGLLGTVGGAAIAAGGGPVGMAVGIPMMAAGVQGMIGGGGNLIRSYDSQYDQVQHGGLAGTWLGELMHPDSSRQEEMENRRAASAQAVLAQLQRAEELQESDMKRAQLDIAGAEMYQQAIQVRKRGVLQIGQYARGGYEDLTQADIDTGKRLEAKYQNPDLLTPGQKPPAPTLGAAPDASKMKEGEKTAPVRLENGNITYYQKDSREEGGLIVVEKETRESREKQLENYRKEVKDLSEAQRKDEDRRSSVVRLFKEESGKNHLNAFAPREDAPSVIKWFSEKLGATESGRLKELQGEWDGLNKVIQDRQGKIDNLRQVSRSMETTFKRQDQKKHDLAVEKGRPAPDEAAAEGGSLTERYIKSKEGLRLDVYDDLTGKRVGLGSTLKGTATTGYGHALTGSKRDQDILAAGQISKDQAEQIFQDDVRSHTQPWEKGLKVAIDDHQRAGMTSLAFNIGAEHRIMGQMVSLLNQGKKEQAADLFLAAPNTSKGVYLPELEARHREDREVFLGRTPNTRTPGFAGVGANTDMEGVVSALREFGSKTAYQGAQQFGMTQPEFMEYRNKLLNFVTPAQVYSFDQNGRTTGLNQTSEQVNLANTYKMLSLERAGMGSFESLTSNLAGLNVARGGLNNIQNLEQVLANAVAIGFDRSRNAQMFVQSVTGLTEKIGTTNTKEISDLLATTAKGMSNDLSTGQADERGLAMAKAGIENAESVSRGNKGTLGLLKTINAMNSGADLGAARMLTSMGAEETKGNLEMLKGMHLSTATTLSDIKDENLRTLVMGFKGNSVAERVQKTVSALEGQMGGAQFRTYDRYVQARTQDHLTFEDEIKKIRSLPASQQQEAMLQFRANYARALGGMAGMTKEGADAATIERLRAVPGLLKSIGGEAALEAAKDRGRALSVDAAEVTRANAKDQLGLMTSAFFSRQVSDKELGEVFAKNKNAVIHIPTNLHNPDGSKRMIDLNEEMWRRYSNTPGSKPLDAATRQAISGFIPQLNRGTLAKSMNMEDVLLRPENSGVRISNAEEIGIEISKHLGPYVKGIIRTNAGAGTHPGGQTGEKPKG